MCPVLGSNIHLMDGWQNVNSGWWQPAPDKWIRGLMISGGRVRNVLITVSVFLTPDSQCQSRSQQISPFTNVCSSSAGSLPPPATNWLTLSLNGPPRSRITGSRETITMVIRMRKVCRYLRQRAEVCCLFAWMIINGRCYPYLSLSLIFVSHSSLSVMITAIDQSEARTDMSWPITAGQWTLLLCDIVSRDTRSDNVREIFESFYSIWSDLMAVSMCRVLSRYGGPL